MQVSFQPTDNRPAFSGLTKKMGHKIFVDGKKEVLYALLDRGDKNTQVGELPPAIFYRLPQDNREDRIKEIFQVFSDCANELRGYKPSLNAPKEERTNRRPNSVVDKMRNVLTKNNVLKEPEKFDLTYLGAGEYKKAYKMEGLEDEKTGDKVCYKVFHVVDTSPEWHKYKCHGNYSEINIATYWKKKEGNNTNLNKFYSGDIDNGYLMDRYIDTTVPKPEKIVDEYDRGVRNIDAVRLDTGHNKLYGYSIDEGGSRVVNIVKNQSKTATYVLKHLKNTPEKYRVLEWHKTLARKDLDDTQKKAGLALSIKHFPEHNQAVLLQKCLEFDKPLVDQAIGYALKYIPEEHATKLFEQLMKKKNPTTQNVLLNEIPLLAKEHIHGKRYDDVNVSREVVNPETVEKFYNIAREHVVDEIEPHLASYVHLLPKDKILPEAERLTAKNNYDINDRLLHKIKFVDADEYSFGDKMEIIGMIQKHDDHPFIQEKAKNTRIRLIRDSLGDD